MLDSIKSLEHQFEGKEPHVYSIFERLAAEAAHLGKVTVNSKMLAIYLEAPREPFACMHPRREYLNLHFITGHRITSPRIIEVTQLPQGRWEHSVVLNEPDDVDDELLGWLRSAYQLAAR